MIPTKETGMHYEIDGIERPIKNRPPKGDKREHDKREYEKREDDKRKNNKDEEDKDTQDNSLIETEQSTIEEYLSKLFCTGCGRHCPLTNPACGKGMSEQTRKIQEYNQEYTSAD